ncbi:alpha/beta hydrolase [Rhodobacteraceae bacterium F11138]|nr:alpha/beta hydrolase [Rhodobacteraceae bacterium F11138]
MVTTPAPLLDEMVGVPKNGLAWWARTTDKVRIRLAFWRVPGAARGTVLIFPGRTEYIEKYGDTVRELTGRGYACVVVDWRGQGLSDRLLDDTRLGHVNIFSDYQHDVDAAVGVAREFELPAPFHMIGHSMGGAIGLRAVIQGLPVESCAFTGPMWDIYMSPVLRPFGWALSHLAPIMGMGTRLPPSTSVEGYVQAQPFENNVLTADEDMYRLMQDHMTAHPELGIGGPTLVWLREALNECRYLAGQDSPALPCVTFLGDRESIVDCDAVRQRMERWPGGELQVIPGAHHELLMEVPSIRARVFDRLDALFQGATARPKATA